jgi:hypothetical protein
MPWLDRGAGLVSALWAGLLLCIGVMATPAAFALLATADAGRVAGRMFAQEAYLALALSTALILADRWQRRDGLAAGPVFGTNLLLLLGAVFCTVAGYFAVQPMMATARAGQGPVSFGALHAISSVFFLIKGLLVLSLAWRLTGVRTAATTS